MRSYSAQDDLIAVLREENEWLRAANHRMTLALSIIAQRPPSERNPDGEQQTAFSMRLIAQDALKPPGEKAIERERFA